MKYWFAGARRPQNLLEGAMVAALYGRLEVLAWLIECSPATIQHPDLLLHAIVGGQRATIDFFRGKIASLSPLMFAVARSRLNQDDLRAVLAVTRANKMIHLSAYDSIEAKILSAKPGPSMFTVTDRVGDQAVVRRSRRFLLRYLLEQGALIFSFGEAQKLIQLNAWDAVKALCEALRLPPFSSAPAAPPPRGNLFSYGTLRGKELLGVETAREFFRAISLGISSSLQSAVYLKWFLNHNYVDLAALDLDLLLRCEPPWSQVREVICAINETSQLEQAARALASSPNDLFFQRALTEFATKLRPALDPHFYCALASANREDRITWLLYDAKVVPLTHDVAAALFAAGLVDFVRKMVPAIVPCLRLPISFILSDFEPKALDAALPPVSRDSSKVDLFVELYARKQATVTHQNGSVRGSIDRDLSVSLRDSADLKKLLKCGAVDWTEGLQEEFVFHGGFVVLASLITDFEIQFDSDYVSRIHHALSEDRGIDFHSTRENVSANDAVMAARIRYWPLVRRGIKESRLTAEHQRAIVVEAIKGYAPDLHPDKKTPLSRLLEEFDYSSLGDALGDSWYQVDEDAERRRGLAANFSPHRGLLYIAERGVSVDFDRLILLLCAKCSHLFSDELTKITSLFRFALMDGKVQYETKSASPPPKRSSIKPARGAVNPGIDIATAFVHTPIPFTICSLRHCNNRIYILQVKLVNEFNEVGRA